MNIIVNELISINTEDNCFVLVVGDNSYYYKSFDLLLTRMVREVITGKELSNVQELVNIYYGRLNEIGNENTAFSKSWLSQCSMYELKK